MKKTSEHITFDRMVFVDRIKQYYLIAENPDSMPGPGLIIYMNPPFFVGKVVNNFLDTTNNVHGVCRGYKIAIVYAGTLLEEIEPTLKQFLQSVFDEMAEFYLQKKIMKNEGYYKRYKDK